MLLNNYVWYPQNSLALNIRISCNCVADNYSDILQKCSIVIVGWMYR
jgi:hypothetical protein